MSFGSNESDGPVANINVTPLVDVMLVLLVIFMVTAPMMQQGVDVNLPKASTGALAGSDEQVVLSIDSAGVVYLGSGNPVEVSELAKKVQAIFEKKNPQDRKVYIKADTSLQYGRVIETMAALQQGGIAQIGLIAAPPGQAAGVTSEKKKK